MNNLKLEDFVWIAISKIHMLIEMVIILGTLQKYQTRMGITPKYAQFMDTFLQAPVGGFSCVNKLQHLLHRYYATIYIESIDLQLERKDRLLAKYQSLMKDRYVWGQYLETEEPFSELEDARNIYHRYHL